MATGYPAYQQPAQYSLNDKMHIFDSYGAVPAPDINPYGMLSEAGAHLGRWWSSGDVPFPNIHGQEPHCAQPNYTLDQDTSTQGDFTTASIQRYPVPSSLTDVTSPDVSPGYDESRRGSSSTQPNRRKRKRSTASVAKPKTQPPATKSTKKTSMAEPAAATASQKPKRGSRSRAAAKQPQPIQEQEYGDEDAEADPEEEHGIQSKKFQERNRMASNKYRVKKREDAIKLRADEKDMERSNHDLTHCISDLMLQIYELKMELLQHTDCDCTLIQEYIAIEAQKYIKDLGEGKCPNATPALPP